MAPFMGGRTESGRDGFPGFEGRELSKIILLYGCGIWVMIGRKRHCGY